MKKVLVTGGAGFIGSHLCDLLQQHTYKVRVIDDLSSGQREWLPSGVEFVEASVCDRNACEQAAEGVDAILHLAAMSRAGPSLGQIDFCVEQNVTGTTNMLQAAKKHGVKSFIYSASSTCYGNRPPPHSEETLPEFLNPYGVTKYAGENLALVFGLTHGMNVISLRYFNVYGPRQPRVGVYALVLGIFLDQHRKNLPLTIHGKGEQRRDFVHVKDVARANLLSLESGLANRVYNVGSGKNYSVNELAQMISSNFVYTDRRPGDAEITLADITRIRQELRWSPSIDFATGLAELRGAE